MDDMEEFRQIFFQECLELLTNLEESLSSIENGESTSEVINAAFRAIHSVKGGAGAFGFDGMVGFCHIFESVLDNVRNNKLPMTPDLLKLMLRAKDIVNDLVDRAREGQSDLANIGLDVKAELQYVYDNGTCATGGVAPAPAAPVVATPVAAAAPAPVVADEPIDDTPVEREVKIAFKPEDEILRLCIEPLTLVHNLQELGSLRVKTVDDTLPSLLSEYEPERCYFSWAFTLETSASGEAIDDVFTFAREFAKVTIDDPQPEPVAAKPAAPVAAPQPVAAAKPEAAPAPEIKPEEQAPAPAAPAPAANKATTKPPITLRVDLPRIDRLVNMVGETVITQAMLAQQSSHLTPENHAGLLHAIELLSRHTRELQESVMAIRAQPVKSVFQRMNRLVRELSLSLKKEAKLVLIGENTEIDTTVIEELADPLTHMIRNSMDHGLEMPDERVAAGKSSEGSITLTAEQRSGRIVITVSDDGRGINRERVFTKAVERGLYPADAKLSNEEIDNIIFMPGFSTADAISSVSGRGVGMDVVRRNIQALGGRVGITAEPGKGTLFTMTLPLTLAVLDGMIIRVGTENFIIPITSIVEALRLKDCRCSKLPNGEDVFTIRDEYIRLINLGNALNVPLQGNDLQIVVVDTEVLGRVGLLVDDLLGQQQIVIKSLEVNYKRVDGISGATILGDGKVALILDVDTIASMAKNNLQPSIAAQNTNNIDSPQLAEAV